MHLNKDLIDAAKHLPPDDEPDVQGFDLQMTAERPTVFREEDMTREQINAVALISAFGAPRFTDEQVEALIRREPEELDWEEANDALRACSRREPVPLTFEREGAGLIAALAWVGQLPADVFDGAYDRLRPLVRKYGLEAA